MQREPTPEELALAERIAKQAAREFIRRVLLSRNDTENLARFSTMPWTPGDSI